MAAKDVRCRVAGFATEVEVAAARYVGRAVTGSATELEVLSTEGVSARVANRLAGSILEVVAAEHILRGTSLELTSTAKILTAKDVLPGPTIGSGGAAQRHDGNDDGNAAIFFNMALSP